MVSTSLTNSPSLQHYHGSHSQARVSTAPARNTSSEYNSSLSRARKSLGPKHAMRPPSVRDRTHSASPRDQPERRSRSQFRTSSGSSPRSMSLAERRRLNNARDGVTPGLRTGSAERTLSRERAGREERSVPLPMPTNSSVEGPSSVVAVGRSASSPAVRRDYTHGPPRSSSIVDQEERYFFSPKTNESPENPTLKLEAWSPRSWTTRTGSASPVARKQEPPSHTPMRSVSASSEGQAHDSPSADISWMLEGKDGTYLRKHLHYQQRGVAVEATAFEAASMIANGLLDRNVLVWCRGMVNWKPASKCSGKFL